MKAIFFHSLESNGLSSDKRKAFTRLGIEVHAPLIDYKNGSVWEKLLSKIQRTNPDFIVGSSIGGRMAYHLSNYTGMPALMSNPAIDSPESNRLQPINPRNKKSRNPKQLFIFGKNDTVILFQTTLNALPKGIKANFISGMEHRLPSSVLYTSLKKFIEDYFPKNESISFTDFNSFLNSFS